MISDFLGDKFRLQLVESDAELSSAKHMYEAEHQRVLIKDKKIETLEARILMDENKMEQIVRQLRERDNQVKAQQKEIDQLKYTLNQNKLQQEKQKIKFSSQMAAQTEEIRGQFENKLRSQKEMLHVRCNFN